MKLISGPWDEAQVQRWLTAARIPVRLSVLASRGPLVVSLWYRYDNGVVWCATRAGADIVEHLTADPRVGIEVGPDIPPYRGVRGTGRASIVPERGRSTLQELLDRYLDPVNEQLAGFLAANADDEVAIRIDDLVLSSWDFSKRMHAQETGPILPDVG